MPLTVTAPELAEENATGPIQPTCEKNEPESTDALEEHCAIDDEKLKEPKEEKCEEKAMADKEKQDKYGNNWPRLTKAFLRQHCKDLKLYMTPELNDVLYLHYKGFPCIENLEEYTGLKCLWLECNGLLKIENLDNQKNLKCLYLQQNLIHKIENLEQLHLLCCLNVSNNMIEKIENLSGLTDLSTLQISHNKLTKLDDILHLIECTNISVLDLSHNHLEDPEIVEEVFAKMPSLGVLYLMGNPVIKKIKNYRKYLIISIKTLKYLDDRPVFPKDRALAEAWEIGGVEAETAERKAWAEKERKKIQDSVDALQKIRKKAEAQRIQKRLDEERKERNDEDNKVEVSSAVDILNQAINDEQTKSPKQQQHIEKEYQNDAFNIDVIDLRNSSLTSSKENESIFNLATSHNLLECENFKSSMLKIRNIETENNVLENSDVVDNSLEDIKSNDISSFTSKMTQEISPKEKHKPLIEELHDIQDNANNIDGSTELITAESESSTPFNKKLHASVAVQDDNSNDSTQKLLIEEIDIQDSCSQVAAEALKKAEVESRQSCDDEDPDISKRWAAPREVPEGITIKNDQTIEENI
ncbi:DNAAF1 [Acanthosepion pharaonis]|uniref:DNAAF1 n=1 Tax=Acanthosepion pharaonis TaxID=158019 RepID=A0A812CYU4_ACAPH|nr:DNAAF1 [Sepia pharaonis]